MKKLIAFSVLFIAFSTQAHAEIKLQKINNVSEIAPGIYKEINSQDSSDSKLITLNQVHVFLVVSKNHIDQYTFLPDLKEYQLISFDMNTGNFKGDTVTTNYLSCDTNSRTHVTVESNGTIFEEKALRTDDSKMLNIDDDIYAKVSADVFEKFKSANYTESCVREDD